MNSNAVVKLYTDDDGDKIDSPRWHIVNPFADAKRTLCTGEAFGYGESQAKFKTKSGNVTCERCIEMIRFFKKVII